MPHSPASRRRPSRHVRSGAAGARLRWWALAIGLSLAALAPLPDARADAGSRGEAIEEALAKNGGRGKVLGVREERSGNGIVYAVKVLTDGRVRVFRIRGR